MNDEFRFDSYAKETQRRIAEFQIKPDPALALPILHAIVRHYLPDANSISADSVLETSMAALGVDSLTLMEITLDVQDAFGIEFTEQELKELTSFSEIAPLIDQKVKALAIKSP
jgi:acyl carrier protein